MELLKPDFYDAFVCIASRCRDTCCAGWEIEVDEETLKKYGEGAGKFRQESPFPDFPGRGRSLLYPGPGEKMPFSKREKSL